MPSGRFDQVPDYAFADRVLALRKQAGLTQRELGAVLEVSPQSIHAWEAGLSYPGAERLQHLIALYLKRDAFRAGHEEEEATALWETVRARATRRIPPFDSHWFAAELEVHGIPSGTSSLQTGKAGPVQQRAWESERDVLPAPARSRTNLTEPRTSFVGRSADLVARSQALDPSAA